MQSNVKHTLTYGTEVVNDCLTTGNHVWGYICTVTKSAFLGIRMNPELRTQLERIAQTEERSMSQICEVLLRGGVAAYQKEGSKYLQRFFSKQKPETEQ